FSPSTLAATSLPGFLAQEVANPAIKTGIHNQRLFLKFIFKRSPFRETSLSFLARGAGRRSRMRRRCHSRLLQCTVKYGAEFFSRARAIYRAPVDEHGRRPIDAQRFA